MWEVIRNRAYGKFVLHTDAPSYVHDLGSKNLVELWSWDEEGYATHMVRVPRDQLAKALKDMRKRMTKQN